MKTAQLFEATAALFLVSGLINGANALYFDTEASSAESTAQTYSAQEDQQQAREWMNHSENATEDRNIYICLAISSLALAVTYTGLGASIKN